MSFLIHSNEINGSLDMGMQLIERAKVMSRPLVCFSWFISVIFLGGFQNSFRYNTVKDILIRLALQENKFPELCVSCQKIIIRPFNF